MGRVQHRRSREPFTLRSDCEERRRQRLSFGIAFALAQWSKYRLYALGLRPGTGASTQLNRMRHEAALERKASLLEDIGVGMAVTALAGAVVIGIGVWYHYVTGAVFILATAILAWYSGFRPALVSSVASTAAMGPLVNAL